MDNVWECPNCYYLIAEVEFMACRFDYGCPRCGTSFRLFHLRPVAEPSNNSVQADGGEVLPPHKHTYIDGYCACGVSITRRR